MRSRGLAGHADRGFFRLTAVLSAVVLVCGLLIAFFEWTSERQAWEQGIAYASKPDPALLPRLIALAVGVSAVPWLVFFVLRFVRRFGST